MHSGSQIRIQNLIGFTIHANAALIKPDQTRTPAADDFRLMRGHDKCIGILHQIFDTLFAFSRNVMSPAINHSSISNTSGVMDVANPNARRTSIPLL